MASQPTEIRYRLTPPVHAGQRRRPPVSERQLQPVSPQLPRITRLMALAIKLDRMQRENSALSYAELARLGHVSRSRVSQILNLLLLAPDIQERLLFLEPVRKGRQPLHERALRPVTGHLDWVEQRRAMEQI
jgi:hypothetical protein